MSAFVVCFDRNCHGSICFSPPAYCPGNLAFNKSRFLWLKMRLIVVFQKVYFRIHPFVYSRLWMSRSICFFASQEVRGFLQVKKYVDFLRCKSRSAWMSKSAWIFASQEILGFVQVKHCVDFLRCKSRSVWMSTSHWIFASQDVRGFLQVKKCAGFVALQIEKCVNVKKCVDFCKPTNAWIFASQKVRWCLALHVEGCVKVKKSWGGCKPRSAWIVASQKVHWTCWLVRCHVAATHFTCLHQWTYHAK